MTAYSSTRTSIARSNCYSTPPVAVDALIKAETLPFHLWEPAAGHHHQFARQIAISKPGRCTPGNGAGGAII